MGEYYAVTNTRGTVLQTQMYDCTSCDVGRLHQLHAYKTKQGLHLQTQCVPIFLSLKKGFHCYDLTKGGGGSEFRNRGGTG